MTKHKHTNVQDLIHEKVLKKGTLLVLLVYFPLLKKCYFMFNTRALIR